MTELQKTQAAYAHFTLEQWRQMASAIMSNPSLSTGEKQAILCKFPSAAL